MEDIRPTQMEIGKAHVTYSEEKIRKRGVHSRALPAVIGPDGKYYISDGHHWASAAQRMGFGTLKVAVSDDFSGRSWDEFARYLQEHGVGYFTPEVRARYGPAQLGEMYRDNLPHHLGDLKDNPGRSVVGIALDELKIVGEQALKDYIEFVIVERFKDKFKSQGIDFEGLTEAQITPDKILRAQKIIATDPEIHEMLFENLRPGMDLEVAHENTFGPINRFRQEQMKQPPLCGAYRKVKGKT